MGGLRSASGRAVTIKDIAQALGMSHSTVSRSLSDSPLISETTKARVREQASEMGYIPDSAARVMRGGSSNIIGFILPDVQNHFYSAIANALAEEASAAGLQLVLAISGDDPQQELQHVKELIRARATGIVITPVAAMDPETARLLREISVIQLVRAHPDIKSSVIAAQDAEAIRLSTQHLLELGHRRIAYLGGGPETLSTGIHRLEGYRSAMTATPDAVASSRLVPPHPEDGYRASMALLQSSTPPTGLIIGSSQLTLGVLRALRELRLSVPDDISLVSYDDPDWHALWGPGITTIELPIRAMANLAVKTINQGDIREHKTKDDVTAQQRATETYALPIRLRERGSCRRLG